MRRVIVFGNSGSGKSTLAARLSAEQGLAHLDLDSVAWSAGSPPERMPIDDSLARISNFMAQHKGWVIEGCYTDLLAPVSSRANELVFMDLPVEACVENARRRPWEPHKYSSKAAQDRNLSMLIDWIGEYYERADHFSHASHLNLYTQFAGAKVALRSNDEAARYR